MLSFDSSFCFGCLCAERASVGLDFCIDIRNIEACILQRAKLFLQTQNWTWRRRFFDLSFHAFPHVPFSTRIAYAHCSGLVVCHLHHPTQMPQFCWANQEQMAVHNSVDFNLSVKRVYYGLATKCEKCMNMRSLYATVCHS